MTGSPPFATLFSELRRRHVLRVGAVYLVAAWLVIQVSDLVVPRLGLPDALVTEIQRMLSEKRSESAAARRTARAGGRSKQT